MLYALSRSAQPASVESGNQQYRLINRLALECFFPCNYDSPNRCTSRRPLLKTALRRLFRCSSNCRRRRSPSRSRYLHGDARRQTSTTINASFAWAEDSTSCWTQQSECYTDRLESWRTVREWKRTRRWIRNNHSILNTAHDDIQSNKYKSHVT